ncbi:MAG TPA: hypothetical protein VMT03_16770 [Polyangia bacterium]|nr:hypothetical protein [Polyangia bacterium]
MNGRVAFVAALLLVAGCGSSSAKKSTPACIHNSECNPQLVCSLGYCVNPCVTSKDCPTGQRCVTATVAADGTPVGTACQAPEAVTCKYNSQCESPLICGIDQQCRNQCQTAADCPGGLLSPPAQICTSVSHLCVDPTVDKDYDATTNELIPPDGGTPATGGSGVPTGAGGATGSGAGGAVAVGGHAGSGSGGHGGTGGAHAGTGGVAPASCSVPATSFGTVVQGDANPNFTSSVAAANTDTIFLFSSWSGPEPTDGGADGGTIGNAIYLQQFDPVTGAKRGSATPLFTVPLTGTSFAIDDSAIAPSGEMVILYTLRQNQAHGNVDTLYAAFLSPGTPGDGGVEGVQLERAPVLLESSELGSPHVTWSAGTSQLIVSWKYYTTNWFTHVRRFAVTGAGAGGDTSQVPTRSGVDNAPDYRDSAAGTSGTLLGVGMRDYSTGHPSLTILDATGVQVGQTLDLGSVGISAIAAGGTTKGFVTLSLTGSTAYGVYVPLAGSSSVLSDAGVPDAGISSLFTTFSYGSNGAYAKAISDDPAGQGGAGIAVMESNGVTFMYVPADGSKQYNSGAVLTSANPGWFGLTNFQGSFALSLYDSSKHSAQAVVSTCP